MLANWRQSDLLALLFDSDFPNKWAWLDGTGRFVLGVDEGGRRIYG